MAIVNGYGLRYKGCKFEPSVEFILTLISITNLIQIAKPKACTFFYEIILKEYCNRQNEQFATSYSILFRKKFFMKKLQFDTKHLKLYQYRTVFKFRRIEIESKTRYFYPSNKKQRFLFALSLIT